MFAEAVAASPSGNVVVVGAANRDNGASDLHVARLVGGAWQWLGSPLISSPLPFTHAHRPSIAFVGEQPVVAWSEERNANLAGMFVARWDGASWTRLGSLTPASDDSFLSPVVAVDAKQQVWLAWMERGLPRVAQWTGSTWVDVGVAALKQLAAVQGETIARELSLAIDSRNHVWLLRSARRQQQGSELALARWDGARWSAVLAPRGPMGKDATVWSSSMVVRGDRPVVAWSQAGVTDNRHLFVAEWTGDGQWRTQLSGLHLVEGVSNVTDVRVAAPDARRLVVSWDEPAKGQVSTRMIEAYPCATGETPAQPPTSTVERDTWPTTVADAAKRIADELDDESRARVRSTPRSALIEFLHGWGTGIRNSFGLWRGNEKLLASCGGGKRSDPEECSMVIIEAVWTMVRQR